MARMTATTAAHTHTGTSTVDTLDVMVVKGSPGVPTHRAGLVGRSVMTTRWWSAEPGHLRKELQPLK